ncbi:MAG: alginate export family protein [Bryobacteraceae bacterium]
MIAALAALADDTAASGASRPSPGVLDSLATHVSEDLPSWWKMGIEFRGRCEDYRGLNGIAGFDDAYCLTRLRLSSTFSVRPWLHIFAQAQDSRAIGYDRRPVPSTVADTVDLRQAYVEAGVLGEQGWAARAGRQPLVFGDMRMVSTSNWSNVGTAFDGVRLSHTGGRTHLDWFATAAVVPTAGFDRPRTDRKLSGFYSSTAVRKNLVLDLYFFWKSNLGTTDERGHTGTLDAYTYGLRSTGKVAYGFDYNIEAALQRGHRVQDPLSAAVSHLELGHPLWTGKAPRVWLEYNYATGDSNPHDGRRQTFEQLYPTPWSVVGRAADFAWRNIHEPMAGVEWQLDRRWKFRATYRAFWLANTNDSLYTLSGASFARNPNAAHSRVGEETGLWSIFQATRRLQFWLGYANLTPGPYLKESSHPGPIRYPFAVWTYNAL